MKKADGSGSTSKNERREAPRANVELVIEYSDLEHFCQDYARNISLGGIFVETRNPLSIGSVLEMGFTLPGYSGKIQTRGKVVRSVLPDQAGPAKARPGMAIQFDDLSEESKAIIDALVRQSLDDF